MEVHFGWVVAAVASCAVFAKPGSPCSMASVTVLLIMYVRCDYTGKGALLQYVPPPPPKHSRGCMPVHMLWRKIQSAGEKSRDPEGQMM